MNNVAELLRLIHNLIRTGTIAEVDHAAARVHARGGVIDLGDGAGADQVVNQAEEFGDIVHAAMLARAGVRL